MADLAARLKQHFHDFDTDKSGVISKERLQNVLAEICPNFTGKDLERLLEAADQKKNGVVDYEEFVNFLTCDTLASVAGGRLPDGTDSDSKLSRLAEAISKLRDPRFGCKAWLVEIRDYVDPNLNPAGFKLCQDTAVESGVVDVLIGLTGTDIGEKPTGDNKADKDSDAVKSLAWEVLARLTFGNDKASKAVAEGKDLVSALTGALQDAMPPEKLSALQLVQALGAASVEATSAIVQQILPAVVPLFSDAAAFPSLAEAAFDVMVSSSYRRASSVVAAVGWPSLATMVTEGDSRPSWLPTGPLQVLLCGRLATNVLGEPSPEGEVDLSARKKIAQSLTEGKFFPYVVESLEAAVARREWPLGSQAYHSVSRSAELVNSLAALGHHRLLIAAVEPLAKAVEVVIDDQATKSSLCALRVLSVDVQCLNHLLSMEVWRKDTLEMLHQSGDEPEATELLSYLDTVDLSFQRATAVKEESKHFMVHAPSVQALAELFAQMSQLDKEINAAQLLEIAPKIPLGPATDLKIAMGKDCTSLSFQSFAERVYGTPTILGWWTCLMEDLAVHLKESEDLPRLPSLRKLLEVFETASGGKSSMNAQVILEKALPLMQLPTEGVVVDGELSALGGDELQFKDFVKWVRLFCKVMRDTEIQEEAEAT